MRVPRLGHDFVYHIRDTDGLATSNFQYEQSTMDFFIRGLSGDTKEDLPQGQKQFLGREYGIADALADPAKWFEEAMKPVNNV